MFLVDNGEDNYLKIIGAACFNKFDGSLNSYQ